MVLSVENAENSKMEITLSSLNYLNIFFKENLFSYYSENYENQSSVKGNCPVHILAGLPMARRFAPANRSGRLKNAISPSENWPRADGHRLKRVQQHVSRRRRRRRRPPDFNRRSGRMKPDRRGRAISSDNARRVLKGAARSTYTEKTLGSDRTF